MNDGIVNLKGKQYYTVARRVHDFRAACSITDGWAQRLRTARLQPWAEHWLRQAMAARVSTRALTSWRTLCNNKDSEPSQGIVGQRVSVSSSFSTSPTWASVSMSAAAT